MNVLFIHQNFPAQFGNLAQHLARSDHRIVAIGSRTARPLPDVTLLRYEFAVNDLNAVHPFARRFDVECRRAEQIIYLASDLVASGFRPDVVVVHCGWGESLPVKTVFPDAKVVTYFEFFYRPDGFDVGFDPEWEGLSIDGLVGLHLRNAATLLALAQADVAVSPTAWQRSTFPPTMRPLISVCHEGIDTETVHPNAAARLTLPNGRTLGAGDEVVTFVARNLEPLRGYHAFMRALPQVLRTRPRAQVLIVGGDGVSYGANPPAGRTWRDLFLDEVSRDVDLERVHFLGRLPYAEYVSVLQVSAVHVYLTYPFVLSWSLLEAMSAGCLVVGSATGPVQEVIDGSNGLLVDFFDRDGLAGAVAAVLADPQAYSELRRKARSTVVERYHKTTCLARMTELMGLGDAPRSGAPAPHP